MSQQSTEKLSVNDEAVLNNIFNHAEPINFDDSCYHQTALEDIKGFIDENEKNNCNDIKRLEIKGIQQAENGQLDDAIRTFTEAIQLAPLLPSPYNNRAQVYRLLQKDDDAFEDIQKVITLSPSESEVYTKALCQRGILHFKKRRDVEAVQDFQKAASLGSQFAKEQMVKLNPYATLCNATLKQVFDSLK